MNFRAAGGRSRALNAGLESPQTVVLACGAPKFAVHTLGVNGKPPVDALTRHLPAGVSELQIPWMPATVFSES